MAKVPFSKLGLKVNSDVTVITFNDYDIEVSRYLPFKEKTELASNIINYSVDDNGFYNPLKVKLYMVLEVKKDIFIRYFIFLFSREVLRIRLA